MHKKAKKILLGAGVAAASIGMISSISYFITKKLVGIALDRKADPQNEDSLDKLAGSSEMKKIYDARNAAAEKLLVAGCESVMIRAHDGEQLVGHLYRASGAKRTIVAMHGWWSSWLNDFGIIAPFFFENDCNVLFAEQRGQGESGGEYMGFGLTERYDCFDWICWLNDHGFAELPIYLCGVSLGASTVLMTTGFDLPENVCGVIADCGYTSPKAIWKHVMEKNLHLPYTGVFGRIVDDMCKSKIRYSSDEYSCLKALENCRVPVLFIHGTDDSFVPVEMTYENYKACRSPKKLFVVPGADHGMSYLVDRDGYQKAVLDFWKDCDNSQVKNK